MKHEPKIIVALDFDNKKKALDFVNKVSPEQCRLKVGKEMFTLFGPQFVEMLVDKDFDVFLDLKFHDIPNTVAKACAAAAKLGVWMINVHASGGREMMESAKGAISSYNHNRPLLTAVTVLTSMSQYQLDEVINNTVIDDQVARLALLAENSGLDGVVCSAKEAETLRKLVDPNFKLVTPGIRPKGAEQQDQKRVVSPYEAIRAGVDFLVIGRPITLSNEPAKTLTQINQSLC